MILLVIALLVKIPAANAIIGGVPVSSGDEIGRSTVLLWGQNKKDEGFTCSGTILNSEYILTAAHCVTSFKRMHVIFSTAMENQSQMNQIYSSGEHYRPVVSVNYNRDYPVNGSGDPYNDIGLVRFVGGLPYGYRPVTILDPKVMNQILTTPNQKTIIAGYGRRSNTDDAQSGALYQAVVPIQKILPKTGVVGIEGSITCSGDSGGPAFVKINGKLYQWGVLSRGDCVKHSIYTPLTSNFFAKLGRPELGFTK